MRGNMEKDSVFEYNESDFGLTAIIEDSRSISLGFDDLLYDKLAAII